MAGGISLGLSIDPESPGLKSIISRASDLSPALQNIPPLIRASVAREFSGGYWASPAGDVPWRPTQPFGTRDVVGTMISTGALRTALTTGGGGGFTRFEGNSVSVGVDGEVFPYASILRGGSAVISTEPLTIKPIAKISRSNRTRDRKRDASGRFKEGPVSYVRQFKMWWYLGLTFGVWLSEAKLREGIKLYPRPFMTANPQLDSEIGHVFIDYIIRGGL